MDHMTTAGPQLPGHHPDSGGASRRRAGRRTKWVAGLAALGLVAGAAGIAAALPGAPNELPTVGALPGSTQFDLTGFIQNATVGRQGTNPTDPGAAHYGGTLTVNGQTVVIPDETVVILPANALTWAELFSDAPAPWGPTQSGLAMNDNPKPATTYEVNVIGNRVGDKYIAGLVHIAQNDLNSGAGYINFIDYDVDGRAELRVGGKMHDPACVQRAADGDPNGHHVAGGANCSGARVQINDPADDAGDGRFGRPQTDDARFTVDPENPTIASATGYPMCIPRTLVDPVLGFKAAGLSYALTAAVPAPAPGDVTTSLYTVPGYDDPKCPLTNRVEKVNVDGFTFGANSMIDAAQAGGFAISTNSATTNGYVKDATAQIPMEIGDYVNFAGTILTDANGAAYVSAHTIINNFAAYTRPGIDPAYVSVEVALVGTGGLTVFGAGEAAVRTKFEGMTTDSTRKVHVYGIDINPITGALSDRDWGAVVPDPGSIGGAGAVQGRWRLRPPCTAAAGQETQKLCSPPPGSTGYLPPTRELRAVIENSSFVEPLAANPLTTANGIIFGQYHAPIGEYIFPENIPGTTIVPNNFEALDFLAYGGYQSADGTQAGQLDPWPGAGAPAMPVCATANAQGPYSGDLGTSITLHGATTGTTPMSVLWTATPDTVGDPAVTLTNATSVSPTLTIPAAAAAGHTYTLTMTATNLCGAAAAVPSITKLTVTAAVIPPPDVTALGANVAATTGGVVTIKAHSTSTANPVTFTFAQTSGIAAVNPGAVVVTGAAGNWTGSMTFTAPASPTTMTFVAKAVANGVASSPGVTITVAVASAVALIPITVTGAEYRTGKARLVLTVTYNGLVDDVLKLMPYVTTNGTTYDPTLLGNVFTNAGGGTYTLTLAGAPQPACGSLDANGACTTKPMTVNAYAAGGAIKGTSGLFGILRLRN